MLNSLNCRRQPRRYVHEAQIFAWKGRADDAFEILEQLRPGCCNVAVDPLLRNLHKDPRWAPLVELHRNRELEGIDFDKEFFSPAAGIP